jgi:hypothetical protein
MFQPLFGRVFVDLLEGNDLWWFSQQKRYAASAIICKIPPFHPQEFIIPIGHCNTIFRHPKTIFLADS